VKKDKFGDRMKEYEMAEAGRKAMPGLPLMARLDGRAFHTFTKGMKRPYDLEMSSAMVETTKYLVDQTHASIGYTQSDEISLAWNIANPESGYMFDGRYQKLASVLAGMATAAFMRTMIISHEYSDRTFKMLPCFDCRVWQVPNLDVATDTFVWREADAIKNSISMAAQSVFSHRVLQGKNSKDKKLMLADRGIVWDDYPAFFKRGTFVRRRIELCDLTKTELEAIPEKHRPLGPVMRTTVTDIEVPPLRELTNATEVLFLDDEPIFIT
jgi:tRNA(His) guanylyltransferase